METGCTPPGACEDLFFPFCFHLSMTLWLLENAVAQKECLALLFLLLWAGSQEGEARLWSWPCSCPWGGVGSGMGLQAWVP